jgi:hypothetical protein
MDRSGGELPERLAIARLDAAASEFSSASRHLEALECMEKALFVRTSIYGVKSPEVSTRCPRRIRRAARITFARRRQHS